MKTSKLIRTALLALALGSAIVASTQSTQPGHYGIFSGQSDIGIGFPGSVSFDPYTGILKIIGGGSDIWGAADSFHLAWVPFAGDAAISADVEFPKQSPSPNTKAVLMFRQSLDPDSAYADVAIHADGHVTLQYREKAGAQTADIAAPSVPTKRVRIERRGNVFTAAIQAEDGKMIPFASYTVPLTGKVYLGIGVCAHDVKSAVTLRFSNVTIDRLGN